MKVETAPGFEIPEVVRVLLEDIGWQPEIEGQPVTREEIMVELFSQWRAACYEVDDHFIQHPPKGDAVSSEATFLLLGYAMRWIVHLKEAFEAMGYSFDLPKEEDH